MSQTITVTALPSGRRLQLVTADTFEEWQRGLSGVKPIPLDGMLFRFPRPAPFKSFQTRDMLVPIDLAFVCRSGKVRALYLNALPGSTVVIDAAARAPTYRYVVETPAGLLAGLKPTGFAGIF